MPGPNDQGFLPLLGTGLEGILNLLAWAPEEILSLGGGVAQSLPQSYLEQLSTMEGLAPGTQGLARMGLQAQTGGPGSIYARTREQFSPLDQLLATSLADPLTYVFPGSAPLKALKATKMAQPFAKGLGGLIRANEAVEVVGKAALQVPGKLVGKGASLLGGITGGATTKAFQHLTAEAPKSLALQMGQMLEELTTILPEGFKETLAFKMDRLSPLQPLMTKGGNLDIRGMLKAINNDYNRVERHIQAQPDLIVQIYETFGLTFARQSAARLRSDLAPYLARRLSLLPEDEKLEALAAWQLYYSGQKTIAQSLDDAFQEYGVLAKQQTPLSPKLAQELQPRVQNTLEQVKTIVEDTSQRVGEYEATMTRMGGLSTADREALNEFYYQRDQQIQQLYLGLTQEITQRLGQSPIAQRLGTEASEKFFSSLEGMGYHAGGGMAGMGFIPQELREATKPSMTLWTKNILKLGADRQRIFNYVKEGLKDPQITTWQQATQKLSQLSGISLGETPVDTPVLRALLKATPLDQFSADSHRKILNLLGKHPDQDILQGDVWELAIPKTQREFQGVLEGMPIGELATNWSKVARGYKALNQAFRENILVSWAFHLTNFASGIIIMAQHSPAQALQGLKNTAELFYRLGKTLRGPRDVGELAAAPVRQLLQETGETAPPIGMFGGWVSATYNVLDKVKTVTEQANPLLRAGVGAGLMLPASDTETPQGMVQVGAGAAVGLGAPQLVRASRDIARVIEAAMRGAVWVPERRTFLAQEGPGFVQKVQQASRRITTEPGEMGGIVTTTDPAKAAALIQDLQGRAGVYNWTELPQKLSEAGFHPDDITGLTQDYLNILGKTNKQAMEIVNKIHVNYEKFNNLESILDETIPFTRWPIRMYPHFGEMLAENPAIAIWLGHYTQVTGEDAKRLGLSDTKYRMLMRVPGGGGISGALAKAIFGIAGPESFQQGQNIPGQPEAEGGWYFNPLRILAPVEQAIARTARGLEFERGLGGQAREITELLGTPFPALRYPLQIASAKLGQGVPALRGILPYDVNEPFPTVTRFGAFLGSGERGTQELIAKAAGVDPYVYERAETQRRLGEMAAEETGRVKHPLYEAAKGTESGPQYRRALQQVRKEQQLEGILNWFFPLGQTYLRPSEQEARAARAKLPEGPYDTPKKIEAYEAALREFPWAQAHVGASGTQRQTALSYAQAFARDPSMLFPDASPTVALRLSEKIQSYENASPQMRGEMTKLDPLLSAALQRKALYVQNNPLLLSYYFWRSQIHPKTRVEGEEALQQQFLSWYDKGGRAPTGYAQ